ncbi:MAG TPA: AraC family transcriptional regulator [Acidimicrobiales bacterium]|nr:AraC family transcriptional regulator [Acidimicrobiales bacterium]
MDALSGLLDGPRARDAFLMRAVMSPPWCIRVQDEAPLSLVAVTGGSAWVALDDGSEPTLLATGDLAVLRGPDHYTMADDLSTPVQVVVHPGQRCTTPEGVSTTEAMTLGVRTWGNDPDGRVTMLVGTYQVSGAVSRRLVDALPPLAVVRDEECSSPLPDLLAEEIVKDEPGQDLVLDRMLDLMLVAVLRLWFSRPEATAPAWYRAHGDPVVGPALRHLHNDPSRAWTVASLAAATGVSRAALARRFTELVGEPPMTFLTGWRLALAADLLREPGATVGGAAQQVGYATPFALSTAFKRVNGVSPRDYRERAGTR